jgi:ribosomal protein L7/L12
MGQTSSKQFKRITLTTETMDVELSVSTVTKLDELAETLTDQLGIDVTVSGAVGYLLKHNEPRRDVAMSNDMNTLPSMFPADALCVLGQLPPGTIQMPLVQHMIMDGKAKHLMLANRKIEAIKEVRAASAMGLKEAKDYVEFNFRLPGTP